MAHEFATFFTQSAQEIGNGSPTFKGLQSNTHTPSPHLPFSARNLLSHGVMEDLEHTPLLLGVGTGDNCTLWNINCDHLNGSPDVSMIGYFWN